MKKIIFIVLYIFSIIHCYSQNPIVLPPVNTTPCVINRSHVIISGKTLTTVGQTHTYTADFFYPNETTQPLTWLVYGGQIVSQNTNPSVGPISVTVIWTANKFDVSIVPDCIQAIPHFASLMPAPYPVIGVIAIKQGNVLNNLIYQGDALPIMKLKKISCIQFPVTQKVNFKQTPCLISGIPNCIFPTTGAAHTYQWKLNSAQTLGWTNISGATQVDYQPPNFAYSKQQCYSRQTQATGTTSFDNNGSCVYLNEFNAGELFTDNTNISFGLQPTIVDEMPYGGECQSNGYLFYWWVSYNDRPWELFSNSLHFTGILNGITKESVRIRRSAKCNGVELFTNILEFGYTVTLVRENQNFIKENTILTKNIESWLESDNLPTGSKILNTTYYDGLARPMQKLTKEVGTPDAGSSTWKDVVSPIEYNNLGQQLKSYLPFTTTTNIGLYKPNSITEQANYYLSKYNETPAYSQTIMELNPIAKVQQTKMAGSAWAASTGDQFEYDMNDVAEEVKIFNIGFNSNDVPTIQGNYPTNELFKTEHKDENLKTVIEYTDKSGNLILKKVQIDVNPSNTTTGWLCTYSVYDNLNMLRFSITPKAVEYMEANGWPNTLPANIAKDLCFSYYYDAKGRLVEKSTPQAGTIRYVYDKRDRLVLTQDEKQYAASTKKWAFVLYDELNREAVTGLLNNNQTRVALQVQIDALILTNSNVQVNLASGQNEYVLVYAPVSVISNTVQYNTINYYDDYNYTGAKSFNTAHRIPINIALNEDPIAKTKRTQGMSTGNKVRVLDNTNKYLISTNYYDEYGRVIQALSDNIKAGTDVATNQYDFANKVLHTSTLHTAVGTSYTNYSVITQHTYDILGRIVFLRKNFHQTLWKFKDIASYSYDDLGRMKEKILGPNPQSGGSQIESLEYTYNINGQMTGINKFYANKEAGRYNKWANFFGLYLGYDNKDNAFAKASLNGNITGAIWCTQGDDNQRKFDYDYDAANQIVKATFNQKDKLTNTWINTKFNFSVGSNHTSGNIQYDANGNILQLTQMGVLPNKNPFIMDDLQYTYAANTNKLLKVEDVSGNANNGALKDFKDGTNGATVDYDYDENGNLILDKNKGIEIAGASGIVYNYLDKIESLTIAGKGTVQYVYDASGEKLQKIFTPTIITVTNPIKATTYINEFMYDDNNLQYIQMEEGRVRIIDVQNNFPAKYLTGNVDMPGVNKMGSFDYYVTDNLGNTRMILTDELQTAEGLCTGEDANVAIEAIQFGAVNPSNGTPASTNEYNATRINMPPSWTSQYNASTNKKCFGLINSTGKAIGPNVILKVMAGDVLNAYADYYYPTIITPNNTSVFNSLLTSVANSLNAGSVSSAVKGSGIVPTSNTWGTQNLTPFLTNQPTAGNAPRAYLNILYFDEQFNLVGYANPQRVGTNSNMDYVQTVGDKCPQNGYAFVYLSNETDNMFVYFDNFKVTHTRGRIVEENHYYPHGLKIAAISSNKLGDPENGHLQNRFGYQGSFAEEDEYTGYNEFDLRNYDPQIGRWTGVDPYDEFASGYIGMGNNGVNLTDPSGGFTATAWLAIGALAGTGAYLIANNNIKDDNKDRRHFQSALIGLGTTFLVASSGWAIQETILASKDASFSSKSFFANFREFYKGMFQNATATAVDKFGSNTVAATFEFNLNITIPKYKWVLAENLGFVASTTINTRRNNQNINVGNGSSLNEAYTHQDYLNVKRIRFRARNNISNIVIENNNKKVFDKRLIRGQKTRSWRVRNLKGETNYFYLHRVINNPNQNQPNQVIVTAQPSIRVEIKIRIN